MNERARKISFWAALGKTIGTFVSAGAGSFLYQLIGSAKLAAIGIAATMAISGFFLIWFAEYERESHRDKRYKK